MTLPEDFVWGVATSAYQIEGGRDADGKVPSGPSATRRAASSPTRTPTSAVDHYHRWERGSRPDARPRPAAPTGSRSPGRGSMHGRRTTAGLDFYSRLVDGLLARGISRSPRSTTGTCRRSWRTRAAGPARDTALALRRVRRAGRRRARGPGAHLDDAERALVHGLPRLRLRHARAGPHRARRRARRRTPPEPRARPRGPRHCARWCGQRAVLGHPEPAPGARGRRPRPSRARSTRWPTGSSWARCSTAPTRPT